MAKKDLAKFKTRAKALKAFKESTEGQRYLAVAAAMFRDQLTRAIRSRWSAGQSSWKPLNNNWEKQKARKGQSTRIWERTGKTLAAVTNNPPSKTGTKKGLTFGVNFYSDRAFIVPSTLTRDGMSAKQRRNLFMVLNWGRAKKTITRSSKGGLERIELKPLPARVVLVWDREDLPRLEADVAEAMTKQLQKAGLPAKVAR